MAHPFCCYIIACGNRTYNGYTNNLQRRLRQHNGEIKGGARATTRVISNGAGAGTGTNAWEYIAILYSHEWSGQRAMQHEWTIKYPTRRRPRPSMYQGPIGRIKSLEVVLPQIPEPTTLMLCANYQQYIDASSLPANIELVMFERGTVPTPLRNEGESK